MGKVAYGPMLALQKQRHADVLAGNVDDTLFLLEHEKVITLGRNTQDGHLLSSKQILQSNGFEVHESGRGGDITYHGPGQIVGYPVVHLQPEEQDVRRYVTYLEEMMIRTAWDYGVSANRIEGLRGIWVGNDKLAAIGVRLSRWTTMHGFALNVSTDLSHFKHIVPCGLHGRGVTSLTQLLGRAVSIAEVEDRLIYHAAQMLDRRTVETAPSALPAVAQPAATAHAEARP